MAKQPKTTEHYEIKCRAEIDQLGQIIAALTKIGIAEIAHELVTNVRAFAQRRPKDDFAKNEVIKFMESNPSFRLRDLAQHFHDNGRGDSAAYYVVKQLTESGQLTKLKDGYYQASAAHKTARKAGKRQTHDITNKDLIWRHVKGRKAFNTADLKPVFKANKRNPDSISPIISNLTSQKRIKAVPGKRGEYIVLKSPSMNGAASEAAHNG